jgi:membrane protein DedA with SNARE-associated domain
MFKQDLKMLRRKKPLLLVAIIIAVGLLIVAVETLEDALIEGGGFSGTLLSPLLNAIIMIAQNATATVSSWGYYGVFLLMFLESSSLPVPSEVVLPFAGYMVSLGQLDLWLVVAVSTFAGLAGSMVDYYIGMKGMRILIRRKALAETLFSEGRINLTERWFNRYGSAVVFLSRLIPGFRTLVSFPAGAVKMPLVKFIAYTAAGCLVWNAFLIYIGDYVGANWREIASISHYVIIVASAVILMALAVFLIMRKGKDKSRNVNDLKDALRRTGGSEHARDGSCVFLNSF